MGFLLSIGGAVVVVSLTVGVISTVIATRRRRAGVTLVVPAVVGAVAPAISIWSAVVFGSIATQLLGHPDPATRATILSLGISEGVSCIAFGVVAGAPVLFGAWLLDRRLRKGQERDKH